jgi:aminoglycoside 3-N-acetyltransferase I
MSEWEIDQLTSRDVGRMREMLALFAHAFDDEPDDLADQPSDTYLADLLSKPHFVAIVASFDGRVVGGITAYQLDKYQQDRREFYIYDLAVSRPMRRHGIARRLIAELASIAAARDIGVIFVQADVDDAPALALYRTLGTERSAYHFDIAVVPRGR